MPKKKKLKPYPGWVCKDCALAAGGTLPDLATYHDDICGVCKHKKVLTKPRKYGYPKFEGFEE